LIGIYCFTSRLKLIQAIKFYNMVNLYNLFVYFEYIIFLLPKTHLFKKEFIFKLFN